MVVRVGVQLHSIERDALGADGNLGQVRPHLSSEAVLIHTEEPRSVPKSNQPRVNHLDRSGSSMPIPMRLEATGCRTCGMRNWSLHEG